MKRHKLAPLKASSPQLARLVQLVPGVSVDRFLLSSSTRARHMWLSLNPDWRLLSSHMYTDRPGIHSFEEINDRLFVNPGRNDNIHVKGEVLLA